MILKKAFYQLFKHFPTQWGELIITDERRFDPATETMVEHYSSEMVKFIYTPPSVDSGVVRSLTYLSSSREFLTGGEINRYDLLLITKDKSSIVSKTDIKILGGTYRVKDIVILDYGHILGVVKC